MPPPPGTCLRQGNRSNPRGSASPTKMGRGDNIPPGPTALSKTITTEESSRPGPATRCRTQNPTCTS